VRKPRTAQDIARKVSTSDIKLRNSDSIELGTVVEISAFTGENSQYPIYTKARPPSNNYKITTREDVEREDNTWIENNEV